MNRQSSNDGIKTDRMLRDWSVIDMLPKGDDSQDRRLEYPSKARYKWQQKIAAAKKQAPVCHVSERCMQFIADLKSGLENRTLVLLSHDSFHQLMREVNSAMNLSVQNKTCHLEVKLMNSAGTVKRFRIEGMRSMLTVTTLSA